MEGNEIEKAAEDIHDCRKKVLEDRHGLHRYEDWDDFIDDATLTEILELNDAAWGIFCSKQAERIKADLLVDSNQLAWKISYQADEIKGLQAQVEDWKLQCSLLSKKGAERITELNAELTRANARIEELEKENEALRERCKLYYHFRGKPIE